MARDYVAGVSFAGETAQTVVLELGENGAAVRFLREHTRTSDSPTWFLDTLLGARDRVVERATRVSVGLDHASLLLYKFPVDTSLTRPEQNEHVQWELATVLAGYAPKEFINDLHYLGIQAREQTADVFVVNVRRELIFAVQERLAARRHELHIADANYFGAQHALLSGQPPLRAERVLLAGFSHGRVDAGCVQNGRLVDYRYALYRDAEDVVALLGAMLAAHAPSGVFYFGMDQAAAVMADVQGLLPLPCQPLNPLARVSVNPALEGYAPFAGSEHRLASCIGIALRKV